LRTLDSEAAEPLEKIKMLRRDLSSLEMNVVNKGLELLQKQQKHHNLQQMTDSVLQLKRIVDGIAFCESLIDEREVEKALAEIDAIELLMVGERDETLGDETLKHIQLRDLRGAVALRGVASDLSILRSRIGKVFESKVHNLLIRDLRRHVQSVSIQNVLPRWEAESLRAKGTQARELSALPAYTIVPDELRTALSHNISGLYQSRSISTAIQAYRELVLREIRNIVRKPLHSSTEDAASVASASTIGGDRGRSNQEKSSVLTQKIRALNAEDAERLLSTVYISVAETLRRLKTQSMVLLDIACTIRKPNAMDPVRPSVDRSPIESPDTAGNASIFEIQEEMHVALDLPSLLGQAVDVSHEMINAILRARSEQVTGLPLAHFLRYFTLNFLFANECEAISGQAGTALNTIVSSHIKDFIMAQRDREIQILTQGMDADNWQEEDFSFKDNEILKQVIECSTSDPLAWSNMRKIWVPQSQEEVEIDSRATDEVRGATIGEEIFILPRSAILCLKGISHFLRLMDGIPSMTPDIVTSFVTYLQMFDSRCRELILRAGAIQSSGLRNITTKHMALTSQALSFIATTIPYIREFVRRHTRAGPHSANLMCEFDKVQRAFEEQQEDIYQKLVEVMESRAILLSKRASETKWGDESAEGTRQYMADLVKYTVKFYNALSRCLPERTVKLVTVPVFASYKVQLGKVFEEADPETETGRER
jgi:vacuolar protein sorting-associated protein 54